ncbi:putative lipoprotein [Plesiocystis pacifica SIR-1]|uniref:Putative lipoprotein n=1 Tax=Plesiocystis pacifica SIR-1 TaxID=391625 RepID=A6GKR1_9BACT|nr:carbohydrate-binding family 9-like protein [Plesiocystis pacifica]EDM73542.1 putative lipoprotein [Plesiocystis pacifica SIR-1]
MASARGRALGVLGLTSALACGSEGASEQGSEREAELVQPLAEAPGVTAYSGRIEFEGGGVIQNWRVEGSLAPDRDGPSSGVRLIFDAEGLEGRSVRVGMLPALAAARQEVAFGSPGQPGEPRANWTRFDFGGDRASGTIEVELLAPGSDWHAADAVIVLEVHARGELRGHRLAVLRGPRSEMVNGEARFEGGRAVLALLPVERRPSVVKAARVGAEGITLDGRRDEAVWRADGAQRLLSSRTGEPPRELEEQLGGPTWVWFAWDEEALYVAAQLPDPDLYAPHERRDDPLYRDEAFEVFLAADNSGRAYLEHQVSARGVHFDARFPEYRKGDEAWNGSWRSAVRLDGELDERGGDRGWSVELAFPWAELCAETELRCPVAAGTRLRTNVFRLDKPDRKSQVGLALSPTLRPDFHAWGNAAVLELID